MKERGIIMGADSINAIIDLRKFETRRVVKTQPPEREGHAADPFRWSRVEQVGPWFHIMADNPHGMFTVKCPYGVPGDRLWVRETHGISKGNGHRILYRADIGTTRWPKTVEITRDTRWTSPIFMRRHLARIVLELVRVDCRPLQAIRNIETALEMEGMELCPSTLFPHTNRGSKLTTVFARHWDAINAKRGYSWDSNPWVYVLAFRIIQTVRPE